MSAGLETYILNLKTAYWNTGAQLHYSAGYMKTAAAQLMAGNPVTAGVFLDWAADDLDDAADFIYGATASIWKWSITLWDWTNTNWPDTEALTLDAIIDAMWDSDKLRWFHFINYIDAMRAGIWNTEIYETHLADWYRHFSTTEE